MIKIVSVALVLLASATTGAAIAENGGQPLKGKAAFGGWQQDKPGLRRLLTAQDLPPISKSPPTVLEVGGRPGGAKPSLPAGFSVEMVASGLGGPRAIRVAPNGDVFVADSAANSVRVFRLPSGTPKPTQQGVFANELYQPYGIAFYPLGPNPQWIYIANSDGVVRYPYKNGDLTAAGGPEKIVERIPWTHHWTRDIAFSPDGKRLLLSVGSGSNVALDMFPEPLIKGGLQTWIKTKPLGAAWDTEERRADVLSYDPDGKNETIVATGLRNCGGLTAQPATRRLGGRRHQRDGAGAG